MSTNNLVYLTNGQQAYLLETLSNGKHLVEPLVTVEDYNNGDYDIPQDEKIVDAIFTKPPVEKISKELKELQDKVYEERKKLNEATKELNDAKWQLKLQQEEENKASKWKFDFSKFKTAKTITFFVEKELLPVTNAAPKYSNRAVLGLNIRIGEIKEANFEITYYEDNRNWNGTKKVDADYGFMFDLTGDEVLELTRQRLATLDYKLYQQYELNKLMPELRDERWHERINELAEQQKQNRIEKLKNDIEQYSKELKELS